MRSHENAYRNPKISIAARTTNTSITGAASISIARRASACGTAWNSGSRMFALWNGRESPTPITGGYFDRRIKGRWMYAERDNPSTNIRTSC